MAIPKIIHYCWFGGGPMPESALKCIESWKKKCPDYEIKEWNESNIDLDMNLYTKQAYEAKAWGFVPDYLRLWIIYNYGGIYLDTDVQIVKSFDPLLKNKAFAGFEASASKEQYVALGLGFAAEPFNKAIADQMKVYEELSFVNPDGTYNKTPSPHYSTEALIPYGLDRYSREVQDLGEIVIYPSEYFCPKNFESGLVNVTKNTYSIHLFDASWYDEEQQQEKLKRWEERKKDHRKHLPNRILMKLLGDKGYAKLKKLLKRGK